MQVDSDLCELRVCQLVLLSGVIVELRAQLKASIKHQEAMRTNSSALAELQNQKQTTANLNQELTRQAVVIRDLKAQLGASAERHMQMTRQVWSTSLFAACFLSDMHLLLCIHYLICVLCLVAHVEHTWMPLICAAYKCRLGLQLSENGVTHLVIFCV